MGLATKASPPEESDAVPRRLQQMKATNEQTERQRDAETGKKQKRKSGGDVVAYAARVGASLPSARSSRICASKRRTAAL